MPDSSRPTQLNLVPGSVLSQAPTLISDHGKTTADHFWDFFIGTIRNPNTRISYFSSSKRFFAWRQDFGLDLVSIEARHIGLYLDQQLHHDDPSFRLTPASIKTHLAGIRCLFDYLVNRGALSHNPALSVRGPKVNQRGDGKTPALGAEEVEALFRSISGHSLTDLRDRALIAVLLFSWVRISAALGMRVKDYTDTAFRVSEKGGLFRLIPIHSEARPVLNMYLDVANLTPEAPLFQGILGGKGARPRLSGSVLQRQSAWAMIKRRCKNAGLPRNITTHSFRATAITLFLESGGRLEDAGRVAGHADLRTTKVYDKTDQTLGQNTIERVHVTVQ